MKRIEVRRAIVLVLALALMMSLLAACNTEKPATKTDPEVLRLHESNMEFIKNTNGGVNEQARKELREKGQAPRTAVLCCSDSDIVPEFVFNASLGDLYVVRTAGNIAGDMEIASIEYAAEKLGVTSVVVLGHAGCDVIKSAIDGDTEAGSIPMISSALAPSIAMAEQKAATNEAVAELAENYNIASTVKKLRDSSVISGYEAVGKLTVIGAKYDPATGIVSFDKALIGQPDETSANKNDKK